MGRVRVINKWHVVTNRLKTSYEDILVSRKSISKQLPPLFLDSLRLTLTFVDSHYQDGFYKSVWYNNLYCYVAALQKGIYLYTIDGEGNLTYSGLAVSVYDATYVTGYDNHLFAACGSDGIRSYIIGENGALTFVDSKTFPTNYPANYVIVSGSRLFVVGSSGVYGRIYTITFDESGNLTVVGYKEVNFGIPLYVHGDYLLFGCGTGVIVYPILEDGTLGDYVESVTCGQVDGITIDENDMVLLAVHTDGVKTYTIDEDGSLTYKDTDDQGGVAYDVKLVGNSLIVANGDTGVLRYAYDSGGILSYKESDDQGGYYIGLFISSNLILIACDSAGLAVYKYSL